MERYSGRVSGIDAGENDKGVVRALDHIYTNGMNIPLVVKDKPTVDSLKPNVPTLYNDYMYILYNNGKVYKFQGVLVT